MKMKVSIGAVLLAAVAIAGVPRVSDVKISQDTFHKTTITYKLSESPGIVTVDILTNGVSIGAQNFTNMVGDVNRLVQPVSGDGVRTITWRPWQTWPGHKITTASLSAQVTVWPTNAPPDWLAVELTKSDCPVTYYASQDALPWGKIWTNKKYKGDVLLMRRIHASHVLSFMGSPETEIARQTDGRETRRMCMLTNDFYIAIYPTTRRHFFLLNDSTATETGLTPVPNQTYNMLRYAKVNTVYPDAVNFPTTSRTFVGGTSYLKDWRDKTGLTLDLPTSAQWEFACRAGHDTPLNRTGCEAWTSANLNVIAQSSSFYEVGTTGGNDWYLFDTIGNCWEWVLDHFEQNISADPVTDPLGPLSDGTNTGANIRRKMRGGYYNTNWNNCRAAITSGSPYSTQKSDVSFRLCVTLP